MNQPSPAHDVFSRRWLLSLLVGGSAGALMAACAQAGPTPVPPKPAAAPPTTAPAAAKPTEAPKPVEATKPATAPVGAAQPAAAKPVGTIKFRSWWNPAQGITYKAWDEFIKKDFPAKRPGAQLEMEYVPFGDYWKKFLTSVAANDVPDALHTSIVWARDLFDLGTLATLNDYFRGAPDMNPDKLMPYALRFSKAGDKFFGYPWEGPDATGGLFYNVGLFKEAGIDPAWEKVKSWTWDDLIQNAVKLTKRSGDDVDVAGILVKNMSYPELAAWVYTQGGKFYRDDDTQREAVFAEDGRGARVVQLQLDLLNKHKVSRPLSAERQDTNLFYQGKTAMWIANIYQVATIHSDVPSLEFDMVPLPKGPGGTGPSVAAFANPHCIPLNARNKDGGWEFISWYGSLESAINKLKVMGRHSVRKDFFDTKEWKEDIVRLPQLAHVVDAASVGGIYPPARYQRVIAVFNPAMEAMMLGKSDPVQTIPDLQKKVNEILAAPPEG